MIAPLSDEEILTLRRILANRQRVIWGIYTALGTGIGAAIVYAIFGEF